MSKTVLLTTDADRYWNPAGIPEVLKEALFDWASEVAVDCLRYDWETDPPAVWLTPDGGRLKLEIAGPARPTEDDPVGRRDCYTVSRDLLGALDDLCDEFTPTGVPSRDQQEELNEIAGLLRGLAEHALILSSKIEKPLPPEAPQQGPRPDSMRGD